MQKLYHRIYSDYFKPSKLSSYKSILETALQRNYAILSVIQFYDLFQTDNLDIDQKFLVLRHDIDTDPSTAAKFFKIEKELKVYATYYFRLKTYNTNLMRDIASHGSEIGYHYEELASYSKSHRIKNQRFAVQELANIRALFRQNFQEFQRNLEIQIRSVASHGDFANRRLDISNTEILKDKQLRKTLEIELEVYDKSFLELFDLYITDKPFPINFSPISPIEAFAKYTKILFLTHPRHWYPSIHHTLTEDLTRLYESFKW